jgi:hypothetical protein
LFFVFTTPSRGFVEKKSAFLERVAKVAAVQPINQRKREVFLKAHLQSIDFQSIFCLKILEHYKKPV